MTSLIVDDISIMRVVLRDTLIGFCNFDRKDIFEASGGREAIALYKNKKPDIVFMDIAMPGMNGLETVRSIIHVNPEAKIVMCTSSGDEADVLECIKAGAIDYITKPPEPKRIVQAVEKIAKIINPKKDEDSEDYDDEDEAVEATEETELQDKKTEDARALKSRIEMLEAELKALKNE